MNSKLRDAKSEYDYVEDEDLGEGLGQREYFFWQHEKRKQNLSHRGIGHTRFCRSCHNCLCDDQKRFVCICGEGKIWMTPYRIRRRPVFKENYQWK